jgi:class 3 adenylate cyclase/pimeloyl-ACP methyl ester carboxylesterase
VARADSVVEFSFPEIRYADSDGVAIAYAVRGAGSIDTVFVPGVSDGLIGGALDVRVTAKHDRTASFGRLICLDRRGMGASDPVPDGDASPLEQQVRDVLAVMDAVGSARASLHGMGAGASVALLCAAMHPERVSAVVAQMGIARFFRAHDYPIGMPDNTREDLLRTVRERWGDLDRPYLLEFFPTHQSDPAFVRRLARSQQASSSKQAAVAAHQVWYDSDIRAVLPLVQAPTLVMNPQAVPFFRDAAAYFAQHLPHATIFSRQGTDIGETDPNDPEDFDVIEEFLTGLRPIERIERVLATIMFTDIVASTEAVAALGDQQWRHRLDTHDQIVRAELARAGGREIKHTGDGFLVTFDGPARAVNCARAIIEHAASTGIAIRAGIHVGECERRGEDLLGIAIHTCARVCELAPPRRILVTSTVTDLTAGSGINYTDHGTHTLKGVPDPRHLYQVS